MDNDQLTKSKKLILLKQKLNYIKNLDEKLQEILEDIKKLKKSYYSGKIDYNVYIKYKYKLEAIAQKIIHDIHKNIYYIKEILYPEYYYTVTTSESIKKFDKNMKISKYNRDIKEKVLKREAVSKNYYINNYRNIIQKPTTFKYNVFAKHKEEDKNKTESDIVRALLRYRLFREYPKKDKQKKKTKKRILKKTQNRIKLNTAKIYRYLIIVSNKIFSNYIKILFDKYPRLYIFFKEIVRFSGYRVTVRSFVALMMLLYFISSLLFAIILTIISKGISLTNITLSLTIPLIGIVLFLYIVPLIRRNQIEKEVSYYLPLAIMHASMLAKSGMDIKNIIRVISKENYGYVSREFSKILFYSETLNIGLNTAIKKVAEDTLSDGLKKFLEELALAVSSGSDFRNFLAVAEESAIIEYKSNNDKFIQALKTFSDMYVGLVVTIPVILVSIIIMLSSLSESIGNIPIVAIINFMVYIGVPVINIIAMLMMTKILPR